MHRVTMFTIYRFTYDTLHFTKSLSKREILRTVSSKSTSGSFTVNVPSPTTESWERGAKVVKNTDTTNQYLERIRDSHDPSLHLKTLEDELKGTMGKALGKQGDKILIVLKKMNDERFKYERIMSSLPLSKSDLRLECDDVKKMSSDVKKEIYLTIQNHNRCREEALHARWELLVHRQAVGFITDNNRFVHAKFPIPEKLVIPDSIGEWSADGDGLQKSTGKDIEEPVKRVFGDQLDWWERVGRWR